MIRPVLLALTSILALAAAQSPKRCFITNDWRPDTLIPGDPNVLIWAAGANRDVLLNKGVGEDSEFVGAIARKF